MMRATARKVIALALLIASPLTLRANAQTTPTPGDDKQAANVLKQQEKILKQLRGGKTEEIERRQRERDAKTQGQNQQFIDSLTVQVTDDYDRFKDLTAVNLKRMLIFNNRPRGPFIYGIGEFYLFAGYTHPGKQKAKPETVTLGFEALETGWEFRDRANRSLILLMDGERLNLGFANQEELRVEYVGNLERLWVSLPYDVFLKVATAKKVEAQLGRLEFRLSAKHLAALRTLVGVGSESQAAAADEQESAVEGGLLTTQVKDVTDVRDTVWQGSMYHHDWTATIDTPATFRFTGAGVFQLNVANPGMLKGLIDERAGTWRQEGDAVYIFVPKEGRGNFIVGAGVIKGGKLIGLLYYEGVLAFEFVSMPNS